jgi:hypothetical protein
MRRPRDTRAAGARHLCAANTTAPRQPRAGLATDARGEAMAEHAVWSEEILLVAHFWNKSRSNPILPPF